MEVFINCDTLLVSNSYSDENSVRRSPNWEGVTLQNVPPRAQAYQCAIFLVILSVHFIILSILKIMIVCISCGTEHNSTGTEPLNKAEV